MSDVKTYEEAVRYLNMLYNLINEEFFESALPMPTITIQQKVGTYGHFTTNPQTWISEDGDSHEINIAAAHLNRPIAAVITTLIHEMCHYWAFIKGVKDTSNRGVYHNRSFKDIATEHGLVVDRHPKYGWAITYPGERVEEFCKNQGLEDIKLNRCGEPNYSLIGIGGNNNGITVVGTGSAVKRSSSMKMFCPCCKRTLRVTRPDWELKCLSCDEEMEYE